MRTNNKVCHGRIKMPLSWGNWWSCCPWYAIISTARNRQMSSLLLEQTVVLQSDNQKQTPAFVAMVVHSIGHLFRWKSYTERLECSLVLLDGMSSSLWFLIFPFSQAVKSCWIQYSAQQMWESRIRTSVQRTTQAEVADIFNKSFNWSANVLRLRLHFSLRAPAN